MRDDSTTTPAAAKRKPAGRTYGQVKLAIWDDPDFVALPVTAQRLYLMLVTYRTTSPAGLLPLQPRRWARHAVDTTTDAIMAALEVLADRRFVVIDEATEELLIRSFIRHDGGMNNVNHRKSIRSAVDKVESLALRSICELEMAKCLVEGHAEGHCEGASEGHTQGHPEGDAEATSILKPETDNLKPPASSPEASGSDAPPAPVGRRAAAVQILIEADIANGKAKAPEGYRKAMPERYRAEFGDALAAYITTRPGATPEELACYVLGVPLGVPQSPVEGSWSADPDCPNCNGDGWMSEQRDDRPYMAPCVCRRENVIDLNTRRPA